MTHSYTATGSYTVTLTVTDNGGVTGEATHVIQIDQPVQINLSPAAVSQVPNAAHMSSISTRSARSKVA